MLRIILFFSVFSFLVPHTGNSQDGNPEYTKARERIESIEKDQIHRANSLLKNLAFTSIGPTVFSGRVSEIKVNPEAPHQFLVAYASGGLWYTDNNGASFEPIMDNAPTLNIGAIAVNWTDSIIWVGTGEVNSSRSSYAGIGVLKSDDFGKSWNNIGLPESHHIGRILLSSSNPEYACAAVLGHLYSNNTEKGVYLTYDGGQTWERTLDAGLAGAVDLVRDPSNEDIIYAATWERSRKAWDFTESGQGSGIYKSADNGETWQILSLRESGLPIGDGMGRIGLSMYNDGHHQVLYALIDNYNRRPKEEKKHEDGLDKEELRQMSKDEFLMLKENRVKDFLEKNNFPEKYSYEKVKKLIYDEEIVPRDLVEYTEDANALLFESPVIGTEVYISLDGEESWTKTHDNYLDDIYFSYGYYFGQIRVNPINPDEIYIMGVPILISSDGGKTFSSVNGANVHVDHHDLWINPTNPAHIILGNDGGINISYDKGDHWTKCNTPAVGQFYTVNADHSDPYNVYGGTQDNGVWKGPSHYKHSVSWHNTGKYPYELLIGGDGMQIQIDPRNNETVYTGFQFGNYFRINKQAKEFKSITPKHELGERPFRYNWQSPIHLSVHNGDILYMGSNYLHLSMDKGDSFKKLSDDLTKGGKKGDVAFGTLTSIHESPIKFGLIYVGTDDGNVWVSKDLGNQWSSINKGLPQNMWVSRIQASQFEEGCVYLSLNGYRWDNFDPMIFVSDNYGKDWKKIGNDLPLSPVNVIKEDPENEHILYVGTDKGLYISLNRGYSFHPAGNNEIPPVAVHDLVISPEKSELIVGTHGRSLYKGDIKQIRILDSLISNSDLYVYKIEDVYYSKRWGSKSYSWSNIYDPSVEVLIYSKESGTAEFSILNKSGLTMHSDTIDLDAGLNTYMYDLTIDKQHIEKVKRKFRGVELMIADNEEYYLPVEKYTFKASKSGMTAETNLTIEKRD